MKRWIILALIVAVALLLPLALDARGYWIRVLTFTLLFAVAKWSCHSSVSFSPSGSGLKTRR